MQGGQRDPRPRYPGTPDPPGSGVFAPVAGAASCHPVAGKARRGGAEAPRAPSAALCAPTWDGQIGQRDAVDALRQRGHPVGEFQLVLALR